MHKNTFTFIPSPIHLGLHLILLHFYNILQLFKMLVKPFKDFTIFTILIEVMKKINLSAFVKLNLTSLVYIWHYGGNLNTEQVRYWNGQMLRVPIFE